MWSRHVTFRRVMFNVDGDAATCGDIVPCVLQVNQVAFDKAECVELCYGGSSRTVTRESK